MAYKEKKVKKIYFSIGQVCDQINDKLGLSGKDVVSASALRHYEGIDLKLRASKKSRSGSRIYREEDIVHIYRYVRALRTGFFTQQGARAILLGRIEVTITQLDTSL